MSSEPLKTSLLCYMKLSESLPKTWL